MKLIITLLFFIFFFQTFVFSYKTQKGTPVQHDFFTGSDGQRYLVTDHEPYHDFDGNLQFLEKDRKAQSKNSNNFDRFRSKAHKKKAKKIRVRFDFPELNIDEDKGVCNPLQVKVVGKTKQSYHEYAKSFLKSKCSPIILIPGIMGSRLMVKIPDGNQVSQRIKDLCKVAGKKNLEYLLWIDTNIYLGPDNPAGAVKGEHRCLGALASFASKFVGDTPPDNEGLEITLYGNSKLTKNDNKCGFSAIDTLKPDHSADFAKMIAYFEHMGYVKGVSMFAVPYDWRRRAGDNVVSSNIKRTLKFANTLFKKKVIIISHSFGSLNTLQVLNTLEKKGRDNSQLIERWIAIGPPFAGTAEAVKRITVGTNQFTESHGKRVGLHTWDLREAMATIPGMFDLLPKNIYGIDQSNPEPWKVALKNAIERDDYTNFPFYPTPEKICFRQRNCGMHLYDYFVKPIWKDCDLNKDYKIEDLQDLLVDLSFPRHPQETKDEMRQRIVYLLDHVKKNGIDQLQNPNVPFTLIFGSQVPTATYFGSLVHDLQGQAKDLKDEFESSEIKIYKQYGDGTVSVNSALVPVLKWAYEFQTKKSESKGIYPVQIIEHCSQPPTTTEPTSLLEKQTITIPNSIIPDALWSPKQQLIFKSNPYSPPKTNEYRGLQCGDKTRDHTGLIVDPYVIKFLAGALKQSYTQKEQTELGFIFKDEYLVTCPTLNKAVWKTVKPISAVAQSVISSLKKAQK